MRDYVAASKIWKRFSGGENYAAIGRQVGCTREAARQRATVGRDYLNNLATARRLKKEKIPIEILPITFRARKVLDEEGIITWGQLHKKPPKLEIIDWYRNFNADTWRLIEFWAKEKTIDTWLKNGHLRVPDFRATTRKTKSNRKCMR